MIDQPNLNHILSIAQRDFLKFVRSPARIASTFIFPVVFLAIFAVTLDSGLGSDRLGFSYIEYVFSGLLIQTVFQSSFLGITSLISDREKDFAMGIFVSPIARSSILLGKVLGESIVSSAQLIGILLFGFALGVSFPIISLLWTIPFALLASFVGGSCGVLVASQLNSAESANRIFPFLMFPLIFLSGAFTPVKNLPFVLAFLRSINPLYYGIDVFRSFLFAGLPEKSLVVSTNPAVSGTIFIAIGAATFLIGTWLFSTKEGNR